VIDQMTVPLVDLRAQYETIKDEVLASMTEVLDGMHLFLGKNVRAFEQEFADYCGAARCIGVGSGTDALYLALRACGVGPGDEVITVAHTFIATVEAIELTGATSVLVDIDPETYTLDPSQLEAHVTSRTRAIVPVHLYGQIADMAPIVEVARRHSLRIVEDACQAHGARYDGQRAGAFGDAACFSFYFSKNLGAYGEGGAIVTNDAQIARDVAVLRDHGSEAKYQHLALGVNSRLDELQAAVLRIKLRRLDQWNAMRRAHAARYDSLLADSGLELPLTRTGSEHVYHLYVVRSRQRDDLRRHLESVGVSTGIHYPIPVHRQPAWGASGHAASSLPATEAAADQILSLPIYPELRGAQLEYVCEQVQRFAAGVRLNA
jgi:dTDP-4-amino-4,6-dideoxygalactose transaminase